MLAARRAGVVLNDICAGMGRMGFEDSISRMAR